MWVDTHCHLPMLTHGTREAILQRAQAAHVQTLVTIGTEPKDWASSQKAANEIPNVYFTLGLHPHAAKEWPHCKSELHSFFPNHTAPAKCVAIGEAGLDYFYENSPKEEQRLCFREQVELAHAVNLPLIIHCRDAYDDLFEILDTEGMPPRGGIMHCFTGTPDIALKAVERGLMISFSGILTFKNAEPIREAAKVVPDDRLLVETDCPFLAPVPERGKPNEPSFLPHTATVLSRVRTQPLETISALTTANAQRLFQFH
jgi:TatD DNase family protein